VPAAVPVVSEDEERPEHGALRGPVERPDKPAVEARGGGGEAEHDDDVAQHVAHGAPGVLDPAVLGYGRADLRQPEWRGRPGVEFGAVGGRRGYLLSLRVNAPLVLLDGGGEVGRRGDAERPVAVDGRGHGPARPRGERGGRRRRNGAPTGAQAERREAAALGEDEPSHWRRRLRRQQQLDGGEIGWQVLSPPPSSPPPLPCTGGIFCVRG
jgi:hypothetical protein